MEQNHELGHEHHGWDGKRNQGGGMKEENTLLPGEVKLTDEELMLMQMLLEDHLVKVNITLQKIKHLRREEEE